MGVAEQGDRDAAAEVEVAAPGAIEQVGALAALEGDPRPACKPVAELASQHWTWRLVADGG